MAIPAVTIHHPGMDTLASDFLPRIIILRTDTTIGTAIGAQVFPRDMDSIALVILRVITPRLS